MSILQTLRNALWLARLALLWFALTLGAALAAPLLQRCQRHDQGAAQRRRHFAQQSDDDGLPGCA